MRVVIAFALCAAAARAARADQCAWIDESVAERAAQALTRAKYVEMCEPCGDKAPGVPTVADHVELRHHAEGAELAIDGRTIDLAYVFVKTSDHAYSNLAALAGCPTTGVSPSLAIDQATAHGVLIHATTEPVVAVAQPAPAPEEPPPEVIYVVNERTEPLWPVALASAGATALAFAALARVRRRRRAYEPRATSLGSEATGEPGRTCQDRSPGPPRP